MLARHLIWLLYRRRRNRFIIVLFLVFTIIYFATKSNDNSSPNYKQLTDRQERNIKANKIRINRETYTTPEPCLGCPGENGASVSLSVIEIDTKEKKFNFSIFFRLTNQKI